MGKVKALWGIILILSLLFGCKSNRVVKVRDRNWQQVNMVEELDIEKKSPEELAEELRQLQDVNRDKYVIQTGDVFAIYVDADSNFNNMNAIIKNDGYMTIRRLGEIKVEGLTMEEAVVLIEKKLSRYIKIEPKLSIVPIKIKMPYVNILGAVKNPGSYPIEGIMRLLDALSKAGGISEFVYNQFDRIEVADLDSAYIVRDNRVLPVDFNRLIKSGDLLHNITLKDNDYIYIPSRSDKQIYVLGEVNSPGKYILTKNLSLGKLLAVAKGLTDNSAMYALVIRGHLNSPTVYKVNISNMLNYGGVDFFLRPEDVVYVPKSGIAQYNKVINSILPTLNLINSGGNAVRTVPDIYNSIDDMNDRINNNK